MMSRILSGLKHRLKDYFLILLSAAAAAVILSIPLQLHFSIGRYQHYGLALCALGLGYILQLIWSWKALHYWSRLGHAMSGLYLASIGAVLYANPWMDPRVTVMSEEQENLKKSIALIYTLLGLPLACVYFKWMQADSRIQKGGKP